MEIDSEIRKQFDDMAIEPADDVLQKCAELAVAYNMQDAAEFVENWMAFSLSNLNGAEPTSDNLNEFERKVLQLKRSSSKMITPRHNKAATTSAAHASSALAMYGINEDADDVMDEYLNESLTAANAAQAHTPKRKAHLPLTPARKTPFSPASYTPLTGGGTPRTQTPGRSGDIVYTFGNPKLLASAQWQSKTPQVLPVKQLLQHAGEALSANKLNYMYDNLKDKSEIALEHIVDIGELIVAQVYGADAADFDWAQLEKSKQGTIQVVGAIRSSYDGPLNARSTVLLVPGNNSCRKLQLQFTQIKSAAIFPGQVVMAVGTMPSPKIFVVEQLHSECALKPPPPLRLARELSFVVAAGPYTHNDDLIYDPLHDLLIYLQEHKPDVLLLTGPFIETEHKLVADHSTLAETYDAFFEKMIGGIVEVLGTTSTTILLVNSHMDAHAHAVYPTPPIVLRKNYPNVHMLADPSVVDLDGITIGVTATDVVDQLHSNELAANTGEKVKRVVNYLLHQRTFYPLCPPADETMCYDSLLAERYAQLTQVPHVLILPSSQKYFIRAVNDCLVINPGRLADSKGGTFARFFIMPATQNSGSLYNRVGCQIRRV